MILDLVIDKDSLAIEIPDHFHPNLDDIFDRIQHFAVSKGTDISGLDIKGLIPKMIMGIAGCERGCPADAKGVVSRGVKGFVLQYIEGGILSASSILKDGRPFHLKMFPDF